MNKQILTDTHKHTQTQTQTYTDTHRYKHTDPRHTHRHTHKHTHRHRGRHAHTDTYKDTYTHTQANSTAHHAIFLLVRVLSLLFSAPFCHQTAKFPTLPVGFLEKDKSRGAFSLFPHLFGITAPAALAKSRRWEPAGPPVQPAEIPYGR